MTERTMTITEGLAELKTIDKRIAKKRDSISSFLVRQDALKDPLDKQGGSQAFIQTERQAIGDLERNVVKIRTEVQTVNNMTDVTIDGITRTIAEWLVWRKEVAPGQQTHLTAIRRAIDQVRAKGQQQGLRVVQPGTQPDAPTDIIVNVDERALAEEAEKLETTLGTLDGLLSLKNATVTITF